MFSLYERTIAQVFHINAYCHSRLLTLPSWIDLLAPFHPRGKQLAVGDILHWPLQNKTAAHVVPHSSSQGCAALKRSTYGCSKHWKGCGLWHPTKVMDSMCCLSWCKCKSVRTTPDLQSTELTQKNGHQLVSHSYYTDPISNRMPTRFSNYALYLFDYKKDKQIYHPQLFFQTVPVNISNTVQTYGQSMCN